MKLQKEHQLELDSIILKYKEIYNKIEEKQDQMKFLETDINILLKELTSNRKVENTFGEKLTKVYGHGKFNNKGGEYELDK
jgi:peptidoglycan hydrolase CwlO-like protein